MTDQPVTGRPMAAPAPRAQTLTAQNLVNRIVRGLLRTPLLSRAAGAGLSPCTSPAASPDGATRCRSPTPGTKGTSSSARPFGWGRNLRTGEAVTIRLKGRRRLADVLVLADEREVVDAYAVMARDNHAFAKFNDIGFDQGGNPVPADLRQAWAAGARAFRLTPR